ncbi:hypothetical protein [Deinococcus sp. 14RED07]|uniref:DUF6979 family protein n=1 Tax=Deinococcus sp. 14RED07 TaxID=2745874 RepID=UPI001E4D86DD|nr:hypothetical protein [Deinococcus sp. 14RED07]
MTTGKKGVPEGENARTGTVYEQLTGRALDGARQGLTPREAWAAAQRLVEGTPSTLNKGCPRSTFVSLAEQGYVRGVPAQAATRPLTLNARHALHAWKVAQADPTLLNRKRAWWAATRAHSGTSRENHAGILDVLRALMVRDALTIPAAPIIPAAP